MGSSRLLLPPVCRVHSVAAGMQAIVPVRLSVIVQAAVGLIGGRQTLAASAVNVHSQHVPQAPACVL